ncbi:Kiwa anti-phage protein KwaB-like domain-containing protein [Lactiplantibacillus plantarum]|uniref:Kiwa anti-phage protein KwaB-like domain-containing protein n=1 Tax=Lactiplantibacillus plantarum TaxID=1590 RepID=UPI003C2891FD
MNIDSVLNAINYDGDVLPNNMCVHLYLVRLDNDGYSTIEPQISREVEQQLLNIMHDRLTDFRETVQAEYNIMGALADTIEYANTADYSTEYRQLNDSLNDVAVLPHPENTRFNFMVYKFHDNHNNGNGEDIYAFRRTKNLNYLGRGVFGSIVDGAFTRLRQRNLIGTDDKVDLFLQNGEFLILSHYSFERMLRIENEFRDRVDNYLDQNANHAFDAIVGFDMFKEAVLSRKNLIKRVCKLIDDPNSLTFLDNVAETEVALHNNGIELGLNFQNGQVLFDDPSQANELVNLMQDSYYRTIVRGEVGADPRR